MSWTEQIAQYKGKLREEAEKRYRAAILEVMKSTILDTPVLEGRLRGDWEAFVGTYGRAAKGAMDPSGALAISQCARLVRNVEVTDDVFFVNRMPYAATIEYDGYSKKAPEGMLRRNLVRWKGLLEGS